MKDKLFLKKEYSYEAISIDVGLLKVILCLDLNLVLLKLFKKMSNSILKLSIERISWLVEKEFLLISDNIFFLRNEIIL